MSGCERDKEIVCLCMKDRVWLCAREYECERERKRSYECVRARKRDSMIVRERVWTCMREWKRVCVCDKERDKESLSVYDGERKKYRVWAWVCERENLVQTNFLIFIVLFHLVFISVLAIGDVRTGVFYVLKFHWFFFYYCWGNMRLRVDDIFKKGRHLKKARQYATETFW